VVAKLKSQWMETTGSRSVCISADMSMSLDGYIADPGDFLGGDNDHRLHNWFAPGGEFVELSGPARELIDEMNACGAVVAGQRTAELMDRRAVIITVSRSLYPVTGHPVWPPAGAIHS
jgi:hypothetical protein